MLFLAIFGKNVEDAFGPLRYLACYFAHPTRVPDLGASSPSPPSGSLLRPVPRLRDPKIRILFLIRIPALRARLPQSCPAGWWIS